MIEFFEDDPDELSVGNRVYLDYFNLFPELRLEETKEDVVEHLREEAWAPFRADVAVENTTLSHARLPFYLLPPRVVNPDIIIGGEAYSLDDLDEAGELRVKGRDEQAKKRAEYLQNFLPFRAKSPLMNECVKARLELASKISSGLHPNVLNI